MESLGLIKQEIVTQGDVVLVCVVAVVLHYLRIWTKKNILSKMGASFGITRARGMDKFCENLWYTVYYVAVVSFAFLTFRDQPWFFLKYHEYFTNWPDYHELTRFPPLRYYYLFQLAFYLQSCVAMVLWDTKRKDFMQMVIHHFITIVLIVFSYMCFQPRIGSTVMLLHDIADIFLSGSKVLNYIDLYGSPRRPWAETGKNVGFAAFTLAWLLTRNTSFPFLVIWPSLQYYFGAHAPPYYVYRESAYWMTIDHRRMCFGPHCVEVNQTLIGFLCALEVLHIVWLYMIIRMIMRAMGEGLNKDVRSDDDADDQDLVEAKVQESREKVMRKEE